MPNLPNLPHEGIRTETALCAGHSTPHQHGNKLNVSHWHFLANTSCYWRSLLPSQATRTYSLRRGGMLQRKLENAFCASLLSNRPNFSIHYIPSGIPVLCWTHANGVSVINFLIFNVSHLFTFNSCPLLLLKLREWPETARVIHLSFVYSMPWALESNI